MIKKVFKVLLVLIAILIIAFLGLKLYFDVEIPSGIKGVKATALAIKIQDAINADALSDMDSISWTFRETNHYMWRPSQTSVDVRWDDKLVQLQTEKPLISKAFENGTELTGDEREDAIEYAQSNFNNDSFWLIAPFKIRDVGTELEYIAENELLVRYKSGGTTPGDVYVWQVDENFLPKSFKMWVDIIPLDGIQANWNDWYETSAGFMLPKSRDIYGIEIPLTDVVVYN
ncbi:MAG: hypothetical protein WBG46_06390 [Nonlabens sp.]